MPTVELKTSYVRDSRREDYCTKVTAVLADPDCPTPLWLEFLERITGRDKELQDYLQRMIGCCSTGQTIEQVMFFLYGTGANGKGVFLNTIAAILNDYAVVASIDMFLESQNERHPTDLAHLWGARLAYCQETERNRRWAEAKIKAMTGGDKLTARFMRQDFFDFQPRFKIIIAGNHKPSLRGVDEAIKRRLHMVPFLITIPPEERDLLLFEKLKPEWPGILQWIIDGAKQWYTIGLKPPKAVIDASEEYFAEQDKMGQWLEQCCAADKQASGLVSDLYVSWIKWNEDEAHERAGSQKAFSQNLVKRGFERDLDPYSRKALFHGVRVRMPGESQP